MPPSASVFMFASALVKVAALDALDARVSGDEATLAAGIDFG